MRFVQMVTVLGAVASCIGVSGCSSVLGKSSSGQELASSGPTVVNSRATPGTFELDRDFRPKTTAEVLAEVKDFSSNVRNVELHFNNAPLVVPMQHIAGSTWRATLSPDQLRTLAVGDQTTHYEANVIVHDQAGAMAKSAPVEISVKGPDLS